MTAGVAMPTKYEQLLHDGRRSLYPGIPSKVLARYIEQHPYLVSDVDHTAGLNSPSGKGWDILMAPGWTCDDNGDQSHFCIAMSVAGAVSMLRGAERCFCNECRRERNQQGAEDVTNANE